MGLTLCFLGGKIRNREEEDLIKTLYAQVKDLKAKNSKLIDEGKKATTSSKSSGQRPSPDRPSSTNASMRRPKSTALTESKEIDIKAASARRSQDAPFAVSKTGLTSTSASAAFKDEGLMQITQALQARWVIVSLWFL